MVRSDELSGLHSDLRMGHSVYTANDVSLSDNEKRCVNYVR